MPRKLRFQPEEWSTFFVTSRCIQSRFLLRPSHYSNQLIIGVIAKAVKRLDIKLHGLCFLSNHYHLLLSSLGALPFGCHTNFPSGALRVGAALRVPFGCHTNSLSNTLSHWTTP